MLTDVKGLAFLEILPDTCARIATAIPPLGIIDINLVPSIKAQHTARCDARGVYSSTLWCTFFDIMKLPTDVADTARWDGGRIRKQQSKHYTRDMSHLRIGRMSAPPVCIYIREASWFATSGRSCRPLLSTRFCVNHSNLFQLWQHLRPPRTNLSRRHATTTLFAWTIHLNSALN